MADPNYDELLPKEEEPFHAWMKRIRELKGLHVTDLAHKIHKPHPWWSRIESGKSARKDEKPSQNSRKTVKLVADALGVSEDLALIAAGYTPTRKTIKAIVPHAVSSSGVDNIEEGILALGNTLYQRDEIAYANVVVQLAARLSPQAKRDLSRTLRSPLNAFGIFKDDPGWAEVEKAIEQNRLHEVETGKAE